MSSSQVFLLLCLISPLEFLLQHDAVDAGLEQREDETGLALKLAQAVEYFCRRLRGHGVDDRGQLQATVRSASIDGHGLGRV